MGGRRAWEFGYSPHLPPPEAWKEPEHWIDLNTGRPLEGVNKIALPVDDRKIIKTDEAVELVKTTLFHEDYDWRGDTRRSRADIHHFYHPARMYDEIYFEGDTLPMDFRETPTLMGKMPRTFHNALHDFTLAPEMPTYMHMYEYRQSYLLAHQAFRSLIELAQSTSVASRNFNQRRLSLASGRVEPKDPNDTIGQEILRDSFAKHFSRYVEIADLVKEYQNQKIVATDIPEYILSRPSLAARKIGKQVIGEYVNFMPHFVPSDRIAA